jgi:hypothetical protein
VHAGASAAGMRFLDFVRSGRDPVSVAIMAEDGAAVAGVIVAAVCTQLVSVTGQAVRRCFQSAFRMVMHLQCAAGHSPARGPFFSDVVASVSELPSVMDNDGRSCTFMATCSDVSVGADLGRHRWHPSRLFAGRRSSVPDSTQSQLLDWALHDGPGLSEDHQAPQARPCHQEHIRGQERGDW